MRGRKVPCFMGGSKGLRMEICGTSGLPIPMVPRLHQSNGNICFLGDSIGPRMEICGTSGLPILMVPRLHQSNGNMKNKLRSWSVQKFITLVAMVLSKGSYGNGDFKNADSILTSARRQTTPFHGG